ncbi:MAG: patatin-like phospholipase family protein [Microthrixaceae bacterium]
MAKSTAFVLSGGGSLGSIQVGMLQALAIRGIAPDFLIGTSVGALNAAFIAGHGATEDAVDALAETWLGLDRGDVFPLDPTRLALATFGRASSICSNGPLERIIRANLTFERLEDAPIPLHVVTTDVSSGKEVLLSRGDAATAVLASSAIPAIFPPVELGGAVLMDGGIADNAAISQAIDLGAEIIYVLPTGYACALDKPPRSPLSAAVHALTLLIEQRLIVDVERYCGKVDIRVAPPLCPLEVSSIDFGHTGRLIEESRSATARWLTFDDRPREHPGSVLSLHKH